MRLTAATASSQTTDLKAVSLVALQICTATRNYSSPTEMALLGPIFSARGGPVRRQYMKFFNYCVKSCNSESARTSSKPASHHTNSPTTPDYEHAVFIESSPINGRHAPPEGSAI